MKYLFSIIFTIVAASCAENYSYFLETENGERIASANIVIGENQIAKFYASSDTSAYIEAFTRLIVAHQIHSDLAASELSTHGRPVKLHLFNADGLDISNIQFASKASKEKEIIANYSVN